VPANSFATPEITTIQRLPNAISASRSRLIVIALSIFRAPIFICFSTKKQRIYLTFHETYSSISHPNQMLNLVSEIHYVRQMRFHFGVSNSLCIDLGNDTGWELVAEARMRQRLFTRSTSTVLGHSVHSIIGPFDYLNVKKCMIGCCASGED